MGALRRPLPRLIVACAVLLVAAASVLATFGRTWDRLAYMRTVDAARTPLEREQMPGAAVPLPMDRFEHYRNWLRRDDRFYLDVNDSGFSSEYTLPEVVGAVARYYLLPAVQVDRLEDATVVLSWDRDPALLDIRFSEQHREGIQLVFVSRIAR